MSKTISPPKPNMSSGCIAKRPNGDKCGNKTSPKLGNKYCNKHAKIWRLEDCAKRGKKMCTSRTQCDPNKPGQKAELSINDPFAHCEACRKRESGMDKQRRDCTYAQSEKLIRTNSNKRVCTMCPVDNNEHPIENMGVCQDGKLASKCKKHLEESRKTDRNRDQERRRKSKREYEHTEKRRKYKRDYKEENPDVNYRGYSKYRKRQLEKDPEGYRKKNSETAKRYREKNKEKVRECQQKSHQKSPVYYRYYCRQAEDRGYDITLTKEQLHDIVTKECDYCDHIDEDFNGIDRIDNDIGYTIENVVPACKNCNNMKNTMCKEVFVTRCMNIAKNNNLCDPIILFDIRHNYNTKVSYEELYNLYRYSAKRRKKEFNLTKDEFSHITEGNCYICKRENSKTHKNGIDRVDNKKGYEVENCKACCGDCNYMKRDLDLDVFLNYCKKISIKYRKRYPEITLGFMEKCLDKGTDNVVCLLKKNHNKPSKESRKCISKRRRDDRHAKTMASKTDEKIEERAAEIKRNRQKKMKKFDSESESDDDVSDTVYMSLKDECSEEFDDVYEKDYSGSDDSDASESSEEEIRVVTSGTRKSNYKRKK